MTPLKTCNVLALSLRGMVLREAHHRLRKQKLLGEALAVHSILLFEEVPNKCPCGAWIRGRSERQEKEWNVKSLFKQRSANFKIVGID